MLQDFFKLGYDLCLTEHGFTKTAQGWMAPLIGGGIGALLGHKFLPVVGAENSRINSALGALLGAGAAIGGTEVGRVVRELAEQHRAMMPQFRAQALESGERALEIARRYARPV